MEITYQELYRIDPTKARLFLVEAYGQLNNISKVARRFKTSRNTGKKALIRYKAKDEVDMLRGAIGQMMRSSTIQKNWS